MASRRSARQEPAGPPRRSERIRLRQLHVAAASRVIDRPRARPGTIRSPASSGSGIQLAAAVLPSPAAPRSPRRLEMLRSQFTWTVRAPEARAARPPSPAPVAGTSAAAAGSFNLLGRAPPGPSSTSDSRQAVGRLSREYQDFIKHPLDGCTVKLLDDNVLKWKATIPGPPGTPYEGGIFKLALQFSNEYPFKPPVVWFLTKIYHCNVASTGTICLDILDKEWSPALTVSKLLISIMSLFSDPNPRDPLEISAAQVYLNDPRQYAENARQWTISHAIPKENQNQNHAA